MYEALGMTSAKTAKRMKPSQTRVIQMEGNERNHKLGTLEKAAAAPGCTFIYALVPK